MCRTLAARAGLVQAEGLASQGQPITASLAAALTKALLATQSAEPYPDAWQTLAEVQLRIDGHGDAVMSVQQGLGVCGGSAAWPRSTSRQ